MNRVDRLFALILFLQSKRATTAEEMAAHFGLSIRTIYRDIAALGEAGVPISAEAGVGYKLMRGYHLPPVNFSSPEANALVTGGILVEQFADASLRVQIHSALLKIRSVLPRAEQERVSRLERNVATTANIEPTPIQANLSLLQEALTAQHVLRFKYQGAGKTEASERTVEPLALLYYLGRWHLIAWCRLRNDYRDFRTDRMREMESLNEPFAAHEDFLLTEFIRKTMPAPRLKASVRFGPLSADRAKREWWLGILDEQVEEEGSVLTLATVEWDRLVGWLLSFGTDATVLAPKTLRSLLVKAAKSAAAHHEKRAK